MLRRFRCPIETKKELVAEVLAGYRTEAVAKKYGLSAETLRRWMRQYRDEVGDIMARKRKTEEQLLQDSERLKELEKKYEEALKLLGEKDVQIKILEELVKKIIQSGSAGNRVDQQGLSGLHGAAYLPDPAFHILLPSQTSRASQILQWWQTDPRLFLQQEWPEGTRCPDQRLFAQTA